MTKFLTFYLIMMMSMSIINLIIMSTISLYKLFYPMTMGIILMMNSIFTSLNLSIYLNNSWMSYIMFLIMIGGMMILFLYFISLIDSMISSLKMNFLKFINLKLFMISILLSFMLFKKTIFLNWYNNFNEIYSLNELINKNLMNFNSLITFMFTEKKN